MKEWEKPGTINTDKASFNIGAIKKLKNEGLCFPGLEHRQIKSLNNIIESDHGKLKRLIKPTLGFKYMKTAYATIKGFEIMRMFKKGQMDIWKYGQGWTVKSVSLAISADASYIVLFRFKDDELKILHVLHGAQHWPKDFKK